MHDSFTLDLELVSYDFISVCCPLWFLGHQAFLLEHVSPHLTSPFYYLLLELICKENAKLQNWFEKIRSLKEWRFQQVTSGLQL